MVKELALKGTREARHRPPRRGAWQRGSMVRNTKRVTTFGKCAPCHANILCRSAWKTDLTPGWQMCAVRPRQLRACGRGQATAWRGQQPRSAEPGTVFTFPRSQLPLVYWQPGAIGQPDLPYRRLGAAKSGWVEVINRHLNYLVESVNVNAGGCPETEVPSSRGEKPGQRRSRHSSRRPGKPATGRRAAGDDQPLSRD